MNGTSVLVWTFLTDFIFNLHKYAELLEKKKVHILFDNRKLC